ncbi:aminotransferase class I/II-fold pyridoxal phosphate-dependent enzyme [Pseudorhodoferax sp. Leaf274]|uniref:aminotransferase class I/II-fold pyridoxal phosphate-dependent enzyme n=1 Tax=Pseudorhodoferax sp. Leaf274 TaxID=1736318 RepID=UPI000702773A|nr:aminotransferase class I/II-fold pyridoxal phosphate-dependent enzyme [Pseudorhodoferax sp. Leaf274]KQP35358.1 aminotransferase [Pseudorhodoferax sp. Leaf274]
MQPFRVHGGPGAAGPAAHDFSTNANACGPCPAALQAVQAADPTRYPDPGYGALREQLAAWHGVAPARVLVAASASEFIMRISAAVAEPGAAVQVPAHAYGDYAWAAQAQQMAVRSTDGPVRLAWACEPSSPLGQAHAGLALQLQALATGVPLVLDCAYAPLRLSGQPTLDAAQQQQVWQLWSPNKALGLTGVRAAYAVAPRHADPRLLARLAQLAPSWPVGSHGVAMLQAWTGNAAQDWLAASLAQLRAWKARQAALCTSLGWQVLASDTNFFCAQLPQPARIAEDLAVLRAAGVQLRDCASFGLPGHVRLAALAPLHQDALARAWPRR